VPQKFIIKARALQDDTKFTLGLLVMREKVQHLALLIAEDELDGAVLAGLKARSWS
jgi:hypothetical protein